MPLWLALNTAAQVQFAIPVTYAVGAYPVAAVVGDFNRDGKLDLAVANNGSNDVSILLGNGDGTFQPAVSYPAGATPSSMAEGDFNGDGKIDLAVANGAGNTVSILLREAFPYDAVPKFLVFDHDVKFGFTVPATLKSMQITPLRTSIGSAWQNGVAERWVGSCRRDLLDHVIALNERHLKRLLSDYVSYYHQDRTHLGMGEQTPTGRAPSLANRQVICHQRLGGLHHRYDRAA